MMRLHPKLLSLSDCIQRRGNQSVYTSLNCEWRRKKNVGTSSAITRQSGQFQKQTMYAEEKTLCRTYPALIQIRKERSSPNILRIGGSIWGDSPWSQEKHFLWTCHRVGMTAARVIGSFYWSSTHLLSAKKSIEIETIAHLCCRCDKLHNCIVCKKLVLRDIGSE